MSRLRRVPFVDSHTGGEPTRVILSGGPNLGGGTAAEQLARFRAHHDDFRRAVITEPRGSDVLVGALLLEPSDPSCAAGVLYFDNACCIGMCGHGTIGLIATLAHLGRIQPGEHRIETPAGIVTTVLHQDGSVSVTNIPSYREARDIPVVLPGDPVESPAMTTETVAGDIAYGGNWFYIVRDHNLPIDRANIDTLTDFAWQLRLAINAQSHPQVDHIILLALSQDSAKRARNFVLCPGGAYDRSPCGTGTSAILACLAADGTLTEGESWLQESVIGSTFTGSYCWLDRDRGIIAPTITGSAFVTAEGTLLLDPRDPFQSGLP